MDKSNPTLAADQKTIADLGGPARVAELLGYDRTRGGVQRVSNWLTRGIPSKVKLARPDLFLAHQFPQQSEGGGVQPVHSSDASDDTQPPAGTRDTKAGD